MMIKRIVVVIVLMLSLVASLTAGTLEDADTAYARGDYATALRLSRPLAEQGDATAQYNLGHMYHLGEGVPQDYTEAAKWYRSLP